ncbi:MAG TPA: LamG-like jellyroll fold domain-containing protein, partial [Candidatus Saccharimonadales bacterium]|nr:LamG-like jellyroll fold domain-containing protein [Candidatus Saccharimonadales bacterium]
MIKTKTHLVFQAMTTGLLLAAGMVTAQAQPYPTAVLADHPTSYWRLQETSGTVAHDSADSDNGSYTNVLLQQQGFTNSNAGELSVGFGGPAGFSADSYVGQMTADFASTTNTAFSAEAWINTGGSPGGAIVGKGWGGGGEEFFVDCGGANGQYRFFIRNASGTAYNATSAVFPDGNWHHIAGVCDEVNGHIYLYLDGQVIASATASGGIQTTTNLYMTIGARQSSATTDYNLQFNGDISDVAIYPYALTAGQVATHYLAAGIPPTITLQPTNFVSVNAGGTVTLTAAATGSKPLSYQWTTNGVAMAGQTNATFVVSNVPANMNGDYIVLNVTNAYGSAQANGASLNVIAGGPQITSDVGPAQLTLYQGLPVTYSVSVAGSLPFYYQWQANGTNIAGATNSSFSVNALRGTNTYNVAISNSYNGGSRSQSSIAALVGVPAPTGVYPAAIVASQPAAYWRLDEASGAATANDYAGGHDGNYNQVQLGAPGYSAVDPDTAAEFGPNAGFPTDSYMQEIDNSGQGLPVIDFAQQGSNVNFSLEAWVKGPAGQPASGSAIVAKGVSGSDPFVLDASAPNSKFRFNIRKAGGGGTAAIYSPVGPDGNWHHLVAVCDETDGAMFLYVDGQNTGTITGIGGTGLFETSVPLSVGAQSSGSDFNYQFNGIIDEVSVYNYALTASQVLAHYNAAPEPPYFTAE